MVLKELTGVTLTQGARTQDALRRGEAGWVPAIGNCAAACVNLLWSIPTTPDGVSVGAPLI